MAATVLAVHAARSRPAAGFAKATLERVHLQVDHGVLGDHHAGSRALRQVHLVDVARYDLLRAGGVDVGPGHLGENVTTSGVDLLALGPGALLRLGGSSSSNVGGSTGGDPARAGGALLRVTGVRFPRHDDPATDPVGVLLDPDGVPVGRVGVFAVVLQAGDVAAGDPVVVEHPGDVAPLTPL